MTDTDLADRTDTITDAEAVIGRLHKMCCDPGRSPRMLEIEAALRAVRADVETADQASFEDALLQLEGAGSTIGRLQVECCAPARMRLYAELLAHMNTIRREISAELGQAH